MNPIACYLEDIRARHPELDSDADIARALHASRAAVCQWRTGAHAPSDAICLRIAALAGRAKGEVLAAAAALKTPDPDAKRAWEKLVKRLCRHGCVNRSRCRGLP